MTPQEPSCRPPPTVTVPAPAGRRRSASSWACSCSPAAGAAGEDRTASGTGPTAPTGAPAPAPADAGTQPAGGSGAPAVPLHGTTPAEVAAASITVPPVSLSLPDLDITVPVDPVGVRPDGQMEIPPLAERAGWYRYGSSPGDADGTAVIAAHVDSVASAGLGPFADLPDAEVGDAVDVTLADGSVRRYAVTTVERVAKPEIAWSDVFVRDGGPRLVLVTCGGTFRRDVGSYTDNVIVTAQPVGA